MSSGIDAAIGRAIAFLESRQLPSGEIPVYASNTRDSSIFATATVAHALSFAPGAASIRRRALDFLERERDGLGLWKHWSRDHPRHAEIPPDLDDTSCASAVLLRSGRPDPQNRKVLLANRNRHGLFFTWKIGGAQLRHPLGLYMFFKRTAAKPFDVDAVVNANVLFYLGAIPETKPVVEHLLTVLREDGEAACDKWYDNRFVIWYFFSRALHEIATEARELIERKIAATTPSNALESALGACSLRYWNKPFDVDCLLRAQLDSGGWPAAPVYHGGPMQWQSEELTTGFCIEALSRWCPSS